MREAINYSSSYLLTKENNADSFIRCDREFMRACDFVDTVNVWVLD